MSTTSKPPDWIVAQRDKWQWNGTTRPDFAEEPEPGQESVWDYPRPPELRRETRRVQVLIDDQLVADTTGAAKVVETASAPTFYLPPQDIRLELIIPSERTSLCEWKGEAQYVHVQIGPQVERNIGWRYLTPYPEFAEIAGWVSFYPARARCMVGDEQARPQPGQFYGGWVTSELAGPIKGVPGSGHW